jgi:hypothetical protein
MGTPGMPARRVRLAKLEELCLQVLIMKSVVIREYLSPDLLRDEEQIRSMIQGEAEVAAKTGPEDIRTFGQE